MAEIKPQIETFAKIKVVGIGGSGGSSVNRMIASKIRGVEFIAMNTDVQALHASQAPQKLHIGKSLTRGLGAGMDPEIGFKAAEESQNEIREMLKGADMVFVTCGLGGGTGSGASPFVASMARDVGALTVAVVTKPFSFEGMARRTIADAAHEKLAANVDAIITIPNDRILQMIDKKTSMIEAFNIVDEVLLQGVQGISEIITQHGNINADFNDVRAVMLNRGSALMGIGHAHGENRAVEAAKAAVASPLLEVSIDGAKGILFAVTGGSNVSLYEVQEAAKVITQTADPSAKIIFATVIDESMKDEIKVTVIATGFDQRTLAPKPKSILPLVNTAPPRAPAYDMSEPMERFPLGGTSRTPYPIATPPPVQAPPVPAPQENPPERAAPLAQEMPVAAPAPVVGRTMVQPPTAPASPAPPIAPYQPTKRQNPPTSPTSEEEELDMMPAFLRKKMM